MKTCTVGGCANRHYAKGLCTKHYQRVTATSSTELRVSPTVCSIEKCGGKVRGHGLCLKHYTRVRKHGDPHATSMIIGDAKARLMSHIKVSDAGCWEWQKFKREGYGVTSLDGNLEQAHRASWKVHVGPIPEGLQINHRCHNRSCINPNHLYAGTQKQNMDDMYAAGRENQRRGEENGNASLTMREATEIKRLIALGATNEEIATQYAVAPTTISSIRTGKTWRHLDGTETKLLEQTRREIGIKEVA